MLNKISILCFLFLFPFIGIGCDSAVTTTHYSTTSNPTITKPETIQQTSMPFTNQGPSSILTQDTAETRLQLGNTFLIQGQYYAAISQYTKAIELNPRMAVAYANRAIANLKEMQYNEAASEEYIVVISDCEKAVELDSTVKLDISLAEAYVEMGDYYYHRYGEWEKSIIYYTKALEINPLINCNTPADIYETMGFEYMDQDSNERALTYFTKAIELDPIRTEYLNEYLAQIYFNKACVHFITSNLSEAISDVSTAIELDATKSDYYRLRADAYYQWADYYNSWDRTAEETESYNKAIADYTELIRLVSNDPQAYSSRGGCYTGVQDYDKAINDYTKAIELGLIEAYCYRGNVYQEMGNKSKALFDYKKCVELSDDDFIKGLCLEAIEELETA